MVTKPIFRDPRRKVIPSHPMGEPHWKNGRCQHVIGKDSRRRDIICGQVYAHSCHRRYVCKGDKDHAGLWTACDKQFPSVESRDRHSANAHGTGW